MEVSGIYVKFSSSQSNTLNLHLSEVFFLQKQHF